MEIKHSDISKLSLRGAERRGNLTMGLLRFARNDAKIYVVEYKKLRRCEDRSAQLHNFSSSQFLHSERGMALILTLMIVTLITAMVVEFAYGVFTTTSALHNWKDSQRLSFVAKSGVNVAVKIISDPLTPQSELYKYLNKDIPAQNIMEGFEGNLIIKAEDENGKFNLNSLVGQTDAENGEAIQIFKNLLRNLKLDESIAERVLDWIDKNSDPKLMDSEEGAKNSYMDSVDELLLIKGIDYQTYEKLLPYVTVYGLHNSYDNYINVNTAPIPVIMSLDTRNISESLAELIDQERKNRPFDNSSVENSFSRRIGNYSWSKYFIYHLQYAHITAISEENKIKRVIECVIDVSAGNKIKYWREM